MTASPKAECAFIKVFEIRKNGGTQSRAAINNVVVEAYANAIRDGADFPRIKVFFDGTNYWLADGFHRLAAYARAGRDKIPAEIELGTRREAILYSVGANANHGLRRTNDDKRRAVMTILKDAEWSGWSDSEVARRAGVSQPFVGKMRGTVTQNIISEPRTYTTKHGTEAQMNTSAIGKPAASQEPASAELEEPIEQPQAQGAEPVAPANPDPAAEAEPNAEARKARSGLTREALEADVIGLQAQLADEKAHRKAAETEMKELKALLKQAGDDHDGRRAASKLKEQLRICNLRKNEEQAKSARLQRQVNALKKRETELETSLEQQVIPL